VRTFFGHLLRVSLVFAIVADAQDVDLVLAVRLLASRNLLRGNCRLQAAWLSRHERLAVVLVFALRPQQRNDAVFHVGLVLLPAGRARARPQANGTTLDEPHTTHDTRARDLT
jgi:hypothetical protein